MKALFSSKTKHLFRSAGGLLLLAGLSAQVAAAQGLPPESFQGSTSPNYTIIGDAYLTSYVGPDGDPEGDGYLRMTGPWTGQTGYAVCNNTFPAVLGFSISYEFFCYGYDVVAADGFSMFLVDGDLSTPSNFVRGQSGSSLGYVGIQYAYLGVGIDEYGSFSKYQPPRTGGIGDVPQSVAVRGAGHLYNTGWPYLAGTKSLPYGLSVATARAQPGSPDYRRVFIDARPQNGVFTLNVRLQHGDVIETLVNELPIPTPPTNLRLGLGSSTGDAYGTHEIRKLLIARVPLLRQDSVSTRPGQPVSVNVLNNDSFTYANYATGTVDLDITTPGVQPSIVLPGKGTLNAAPNGVVTFTPANGWSGAISTAYSADDVVGQNGTPSNMKFTVDAAAAAPLPVTLTSFTVQPRGQQAVVQWGTASEVNNDHFVVKRSFDGRTFTELTTVKGRGTTSQANTYEWVDEQSSRLAGNGRPVYYVLQQVDLGGKATYSPVAVASFGSSGAVRLYPNPATSAATLDLSTLDSGTYQVQVLSVMGQVVSSYSLTGQAQHQLDVQALPPGAYVVRVTGAGTNLSLQLHRN